MNQQSAANLLKIFYREHKRLPTYSEMCFLFGFKSKKACFDVIRKLITQGILQKDDRGRLTFTTNEYELPYLGSIQAGFPSPAEEQLYHTMSFDQYLIEKPEQSFILKVSGESMIGAGINPGDLVVVEKIIGTARQPKPGQIVVAYIDNEWTLKYFEQEDGKVALVPANPKFPKLYPQNELTIWGVVVSVTRKYN